MANINLRQLINECLTEIFKESEYFQDYENLMTKSSQEYYSHKKQSWKLIPKEMLINIWATYVKFGRIDENKLDKIWLLDAYKEFLENGKINET